VHRSISATAWRATYVGERRKIRYQSIPWTLCRSIRERDRRAGRQRDGSSGPIPSTRTTSSRVTHAPARRPQNDHRRERLSESFGPSAASKWSARAAGNGERGRPFELMRSSRSGPGQGIRRTRLPGQLVAAGLGIASRVMRTVDRLPFASHRAGCVEQHLAIAVQFDTLSARSCLRRSFPRLAILRVRTRAMHNRAIPRTSAAPARLADAAS